MPPKKKQEASKKTIDKAKEKIIEVVRRFVIASCFCPQLRVPRPVLVRA